MRKALEKTIFRKREKEKRKNRREEEVGVPSVVMIDI